MILKTKRKFCVCGGTIVHVGRKAHVTIYTETGPMEVEHLECRCRKCSKGFYFGYASDIQIDDEEEGPKRQFKFYEEDCLESEVSL